MKHNPWGLHEFAAAEKWIKKNWTKEHCDAALREGWCISDSQGSENSPWQVQKIDCPDDIDDIAVPELKEDEDAWLRVRTGTGLHHSLARQFLSTFVPDHEWKYINDWYAKAYPMPT